MRAAARVAFAVAARVLGGSEKRVCVCESVAIHCITQRCAVLPCVLRWP